MHRDREETQAKRIKQYRIWIIVLVVLLIATNVFGVYYAMDEIKNSKVNPYPLVDPARQYIRQEDMVVNIQPLREYLNGIVAKHGVTSMSVYFEMLNTGGNISINQDLHIWPASLVKLPLAMAVIKKVEKEEWKWQNELVLMPEDAEEHSGQLYNRQIGSTFTIEELVRELLVNSDNTAYQILSRNITESEMQEVVNETGLELLLDEEGKFSAKEYTRLLRALYTSSFLKRTNSEKVLEYLNQSPFKEFLSQGLPADVKFSHKYGENKELDVFSDAGIVYAGNRPYAIAVMIQERGDPEQAKERVKKIMKEVSEYTYNYVTK